MTQKYNNFLPYVYLFHGKKGEFRDVYSFMQKYNLDLKGRQDLFELYN